MRELTYAQKFEIAKGLREQYPAGKRVELVEMDDPFTKIPQGTLGTVRNVDDMATIHVSWDNGSSLGVIYGEDIIRDASESEEPYITCNNCGSKIVLGSPVWCKSYEDYCSPNCVLEYYGISESVVEEDFFG